MRHELFFLIKDKAALLWMTIAFISAMMAVLLGLNEVHQQRTALAELQSLDRVERELTLNEQSDWGSAAYYSFHLTYDEPSDFAFAAFGERDVSPWKHRVRLLALEGQIYETDADNPDFALIGRFDYSFVAALLAPLLIILLLYDLRSGERAAGRLNLIETSAGQARRVWLMRCALRLSGLYMALLIPLWVGGAVEGTAVTTLLGASFTLLIYILFWGAVVYLLAKAARTGSANLTYLTGIWLFICAILPALLVLGVNSSVSLPDGGEIVLTQREAVNDAWDIPKEATYKDFLARYPEWADYTEWDIADGFEWKWYYAFQQVGDQKAEGLSQDYRGRRLKRDKLISRLSLISPTSLMQRRFEKLAKTDASASLAYEKIPCRVT
jgi:ABC-2 type transport system permease protein